MQSPSAARFDAGFSLVETMIAALLLATSLTALAELFAIAVRNNVEAKHSTAAAVLAGQKIEQLRGDAFQMNAGGHGDNEEVPDGTAYTRRWSVEAVPASAVVVLQVLVTRRPAGVSARVTTIARQAP